MNTTLDLQIACKNTNIPTQQQFQTWVNTTLLEIKYNKDTELTIRIVDEKESADLNFEYRKKSGPTNVLSFPAEMKPQFDYNLLGDIVICASIVEKQAKECNKEITAHWAHMVIHGVLHLLGYNHINEKDAIKMEPLETKTLTTLGYNSPYGEKP